tara:strand:- start:165 stop:401 length:237 start_codon:yes stop_codon:yes gene_type:complete
VLLPNECTNALINIIKPPMKKGIFHTSLKYSLWFEIVLNIKEIRSEIAARNKAEGNKKRPMQNKLNPSVCAVNIFFKI